MNMTKNMVFLYFKYRFNHKLSVYTQNFLARHHSTMTYMDLDSRVMKTLQFSGREERLCKDAVNLRKAIA